MYVHELLECCNKPIKNTAVQLNQDAHTEWSLTGGDGLQESNHAGGLFREVVRARLLSGRKFIACKV